VLIIGAGVAGLAAIAAARGLGAMVRAFDTREACREQVQSLGAEFLTVAVKESGDGQAATPRRCRRSSSTPRWPCSARQAREVDVVITTALIPEPARAQAVAHRHGGVDAAGLGGGRPGLPAAAATASSPSRGRRVHTGVTIVGDDRSHAAHGGPRQPPVRPQRAALLDELGGGDEVVDRPVDDHPRHHRAGAGGGALARATARAEPGPGEAVPKPPPARPPPPSRARAATGQVWVDGAGLQRRAGRPGVLGRFAPAEFLQHFTVFVLACIIGWQVIWNVTPALHTPLMSVTNAISGIILIGGLLQVGSTSASAGFSAPRPSCWPASTCSAGSSSRSGCCGMFRRHGEAR
jgi:NAD(P) transhydrogenase subunit alpha